MPSSKTPLPAKQRPKKTPETDTGKSPAILIDKRVKELNDWRGELLSRLRAVILSASPSVIEEWKWNAPVWSSGSIICTGETYKKAVKLTFVKGASLPDPEGLFNSSMEGNTRRAIDFPEGTRINEQALRALIQAAVTMKSGKTPRKAKSAA